MFDVGAAEVIVDTMKLHEKSKIVQVGRVDCIREFQAITLLSIAAKRRLGDPEHGIEITRAMSDVFEARSGRDSEKRSRRLPRRGFRHKVGAARS